MAPLLPVAMGNFTYQRGDLRNESNIFFSVDRGINQERTEKCINALLRALMQKFSVLFSVDTSKKY